jgi:hypothetical protein
VTLLGVTVRSAPGGVEKAVRAELRQLRASVASDGSAALAVSLARQIDTARGAVAAAAAAGQLRQLLIDVRRAAAEARPERDAVDDLRNDELAARRAAG